MRALGKKNVIEVSLVMEISLTYTARYMQIHMENEVKKQVISFTMSHTKLKQN